ncbi:MAG: Ig-like domain-containing protein [Gemmatimonadetes bacterium]|nr:Ig-like domain-containing protein [Gemmatimonadota bacterium]
MRSRRRIPVLIVAAIAAASCGGDKAAGPSGPPTQLTALGATTFLGRAGFTLAESLQVEVRNASGVMANVSVTFAVVSGGGSLSSTTVLTDAKGIAAARWTLGGLLGAQVVQARVAALTPVTFSTEVTAGPTITLVALAGGGQVGAANTMLPVQPRVLARDAFGNPVRGETITFSSTGGVNDLAGATQITDVNGIAALGSWTLGPCAGAVQVTASASTAAAATFDATATGGGSYCVELQYTTTPDPALRAAAERAAAKWSRAIVSDFPVERVIAGSAGCAGISVGAIDRNVKAAYIYVQLAPIASSTPGLVTLGSAGPCFVRGGNGLTLVGGMRLNSDFLLGNLSANQIEDVILHEMGHVLGFGTLWRGIAGIPALPVLLQNPAPAGTPSFTGTNAVAAFVNVGGPAGAASVPVEACGGGGTVNGHWTEAVFGDELMTGYISAPAGQRNPFSQVSIAAMRDMGYSVDLTEAAPYTLAGKPCPALLVGAAGTGAVVIGNTVVVEELWQPTHVVRAGRAERIIRR